MFELKPKETFPMKIILPLAALASLAACNSEPAVAPVDSTVDTAVLPIDNTMAMGDTMAAGTVNVTVTGVTPGAGPVLVALQTEAGFAKVGGDYTATVDPTSSTVTASVTGVPAGRYAVAVVQDTNMDGTLTVGATGPDEPYGFSGTRQAGAPTFAPAAIDVTDMGGTATVAIAG